MTIMNTNVEIKNLYGINKVRDRRLQQLERLGYSVITPSNVANIAETYKSKGYKNNTISAYFGEIRKAVKNHLFSVGKHEEAFLYSTVFQQFKLKADRDCTAQSDIITKEKLEELLKLISDRKFKLIVLFFMATGVRVTELCNIKLKDCTFSPEEQLVYIKIIQGKNNRSRVVVIPYILYNAIREFQSLTYLFENNMGRKFRQPLISKKLQRLAKRFGQRLYPHLFRHSYITMMLESGYDMKKLSKLCGVMPETMVRTYFHVKIDFKGAAEMARPMLSLLQ